jgi:hypothetical protein
MSTAPVRVRRSAGVAAIVALALALVACGGGSSSESLSDANDKAEAASLAADWAVARADLALYCLKQLSDGSGDRLEADDSTDALIKIARANPDDEYEPGLTYRQSLGDQASDLVKCDTALADKLDRALLTLPGQ